MPESLPLGGLISVNHGEIGMRSPCDDTLNDGAMDYASSTLYADTDRLGIGSIPVTD